MKVPPASAASDTMHTAHWESLCMQMREHPHRGLFHLGLSLPPESPGPPVQGEQPAEQEERVKWIKTPGVQGADIFPLKEN